MITILNRKELMTDSSPEELARVKEALKAKDIEFEVRTLRSRANLAFSRDRQNISFVYRLYVRRCDYDRAWATAYQEDGSK